MNRDPTTWLRDRVAGFADLTPSERKAIRDFTLLWSLFEARLTGTNASVQAIETAMERLRAGGALEGAPLEPPLRYFRERYAPEGILGDRFQALRLTGRGRPLVESALTGAPTDAVDIATALMIIVYRLRNNLFHGNKWDDGIHDQRHNFENANRVLMTLMDLHHSGPAG